MIKLDITILTLHEDLQLKLLGFTQRLASHLLATLWLLMIVANFGLMYACMHIITSTEKTFLKIKRLLHCVVYIFGAQLSGTELRWVYRLVILEDRFQPLWLRNLMGSQYQIIYDKLSRNPPEIDGFK